ncbi:tRNA lysidine(34) synthetase TilS [Campylobacter sp. MIT 12-5580]|uniref:tRNA lysidine(34) synthetase TilS n=1 Tax=Campylobacter sp. MIT 12-5580 TaxID=2040651 RepID=UPI0010F734F6|nr:tRNA lysidine(34) synthetase TilS [Campylobacter sp. MIT 12-5580]TKX30270.1 tRNA lysidine(34) synthetase TilS [Campylobacter sp. MIT 12-5580]
MKLSQKSLQALSKAKNLLGFSYQSDSTALFYTLLEQNISFDLALVDYGTRAQSKAELKAAKELAKKHNKQIFIKTAPKFKNNFEKNARDFRYSFFKELCEQKGYENLILAHQLDDKFEWFLMQLKKGAGLSELLGMQELQKEPSFTLVRPFLSVSKDEILDFLEQKHIVYFKDLSNEDERFERNYIRKHFSKPFLKLFAKGVKRSFNYLQKDTNALYQNAFYKEFKGISILSKQESLIAKAIKAKGLRISAKQREQMMKQDGVISGKIALCFKDELAFVFEYKTCEKIPKEFKERYRKAGIPKLLRAYFYTQGINEQDFLNEIQQSFKLGS